MSDLEKLQALMSEYLRSGVDARELYQYYSQHVMYHHLQQAREKGELKEDVPFQPPQITSPSPPHTDENDNVAIPEEDTSVVIETKIEEPRVGDDERRPVVSLDRIRHKRQTLQDMARPLKHWLYKHRDNPYPTKSEKMSLANLSHMTLTQVSNWFANARRRLKNTVRDPELNWENRIKMYNSCVEGNQELLSIDSEDDEDEDMKVIAEPVEEPPTMDEPSMPLDLSDHTVPGQAIPSPSPSPPMQTDEAPHPPKYKQCILQRYLTDSYQHAQNMQSEYPRQRNPSGSLSSHDFEEMSTSFGGSPLREHQFDEQHETTSEEIPSKTENAREREDLYWKEISAALALTTLARSKVVTPQ